MKVLDPTSARDADSCVLEKCNVGRGVTLEWRQENVVHFRRINADALQGLFGPL
jgi:hypothetical protein